MPGGGPRCGRVGREWVEAFEVVRWRGDMVPGYGGAWRVLAIGL